MTIYTFVAEKGPGDPGDQATVLVTFDDQIEATLDNVVGKFVLFLQGVSFTKSSIRDYIDHKMIAIDHEMIA